jgi:putative DNA primase/helicase
MRQDFFEFAPQFTLIVVGNHKPALRGVDEAIRSRLLLAPFTQRIPDDEIDKDLPEKLKTEAPAILRWMVDGCLAWQREGLNPPQSAIAMTEAYIEGEDTVAEFIDDCCEVGPDKSAMLVEIFEQWRSWASQRGVETGRSRELASALEAKGFRRTKPKNRVKIHGLAVLSPAARLAAVAG